MLHFEELSCPPSIDSALFCIGVAANFSEQLIRIQKIDRVYKEVRYESLGWPCCIAIGLIEVEKYLCINNDIKYIFGNIRPKKG